MLANIKQNALNELIDGASYDELIWINGYLSGILSSGRKTGIEKTSAKTAFTGKITIAFGTETGNAKSLSGKLAAIAKQKGIASKVVALDQYRLSDLAKEEALFIVISTQGDGEPPAAARKFYDYLHQDGLRLLQLKYAVLALGDRSYPLFCQAGTDVDKQLEHAGATRIAVVQKCDVDYEAEAVQWFERALAALSNPSELKTSDVSIQPVYGRKTYAGTVLANINLNDLGSHKQTHHIEIEAAGVSYEPGDSVSIVPENNPAWVAEILQLTGISADKQIRYKNETQPIGLLLRTKINIRYLHERVVKRYAAIVQQDIPETKISLIDLLRIYPVRNTDEFEKVIQVLEPIIPRQYSIASSPSFHDGAIHLLVSRDQFYVNEELHYGLASDYLCQLAEGEDFSFTIHPNKQFRLPAADRDIILIGPGTGIAPFRSFLSERDAQQASGRNWLFFGAPHFTTDFLYQTEIQHWCQNGLLTNISLAFSRDQPEKIYVQHRLREQAKEVYEWLQGGASVYVCGNKDPMSVDVETALLQVIAAEGKLSDEAAIVYLEALKNDGRYLKDVY